MRVIGAGFGRTGTTSLKAALEELGFGPSYGLTEVFRNPKHAGVWEAARGPAGEEVDWEGFLGGYEVVVDWPACSFYEELMEAFPGAPALRIASVNSNRASALSSNRASALSSKQSCRRSRDPFGKEAWKLLAEMLRRS